jgi:guanylate kinase
MIQLSDIRALLVAGASGVGKGTIVSHLTSPPSSKFRATVSCTTRKKRPEEVHGEHYWFLTRDQFIEHQQNNDFLESAEVHGNMYGTLKRELVRLADMGFVPVIEIDVQGAQQLLEVIPNTCFVFIEPPSMEELERRLRGRGTEDEESIRKRLARALEESAEALSPPFVHIVNDVCPFETTAKIVSMWRNT